MYVAKTKALISSAATPSILVSKNLGVMVIVHNVDSDSRNIPFHRSGESRKIAIKVIVQMRDHA